MYSIGNDAAGANGIIGTIGDETGADGIAVGAEMILGLIIGIDLTAACCGVIIETLLLGDW